MAGKTTFKNGPHVSRIGGFVKPIKLDGNQLARLENVIEKTLITDEIIQVEDALETFRHMKEIALSDRVSAQDMKRTLATISKSDPETARAAMENCDDSTSAEILRALVKDFDLGKMSLTEQLDPPAHLIPQAARVALASINDQSNSGGRPIKGYQTFIAKFAVASWQRFGRTDMQCHYTSETIFYGKRGSPLHQWASAMFNIVDGMSSDKQVQLCMVEELKK